MCGSTLNCQTLCPAARPRYSLVVDEDVKKPTNQPIKQINDELVLRINNDIRVKFIQVCEKELKNSLTEKSVFVFLIQRVILTTMLTCAVPSTRCFGCLEVIAKRGSTRIGF